MARKLSPALVSIILALLLLAMLGVTWLAFGLVPVASAAGASVVVASFAVVWIEAGPLLSRSLRRRLRRREAVFVIYDDKSARPALHLVRQLLKRFAVVWTDDLSGNLPRRVADRHASSRTNVWSRAIAALPESAESSRRLRSVGIRTDLLRSSMIVVVMTDNHSSQLWDELDLARRAGAEIVYVSRVSTALEGAPDRRTVAAAGKNRPWQAVASEILQAV